jgi:Secretion system C-terminal sorting domain
MKKLLLLPVLCFSLNAGAQGSILLSNNDNASTLTPNAIIQLTTAASTPTSVFNLKFNIDVKNISGSTKTFLVKRYDVTLNPGADAYYCFAGNCYGPPTTLAPTALTLTSNQSASQVQGQYQILTADLDEASTIGYSLIKYTFFDENNVSDSVQISLRYNSPVGVSELKKNLKSMELFPNPSEGNSTLLINAQSAFNGKVMVYNALGDLVSEQTATIVQGQSKIELNLQALSPGVYLVSVKAGNASLTKRLVIK